MPVVRELTLNVPRRVTGICELDVDAIWPRNMSRSESNEANIFSYSFKLTQSQRISRGITHL
jgi:hypothetical protein